MKLSKGFTLIELIISVFILSVAVVGIFNAFSIMIILTSDAADRLTATYLAQEGEEIVRNIRDTNWLNMDACNSPTPPSYCPASWVDGLTADGLNGSPNCSNGCEADYTTDTNISGAWVMKPWSASGLPLLINSGNGFYNYSSGTITKFKRKIIITSIPDANNVSGYILKVEVQVSWNQKATILNAGYLAGNCQPANCIKVEGTMYDWYNYSG